MVRFSLKCNCADAIFANGGQEMLEEEYKEYLIPKEEYEDGFDITLKIDTSGFPATQKIKKSDDEETAQKKRDENDEIRKTR